MLAGPQQAQNDQVHINFDSETSDHHPDSAEKLSDVQGATLTEPRDDSSGQSARNHGCADANDEERFCDAPRVPVEEMDRVKRPDREDFVRDIREKLNSRELPQVRMRTQQNERAHRIRAA